MHLEVFDVEKGGLVVGPAIVGFCKAGGAVDKMCSLERSVFVGSSSGVDVKGGDAAAGGINGLVQGEPLPIAGLPSYWLLKADRDYELNILALCLPKCEPFFVVIPDVLQVNMQHAQRLLQSVEELIDYRLCHYSQSFIVNSSLDFGVDLGVAAHPSGYPVVAEVGIVITTFTEEQDDLRPDLIIGCTEPQLRSLVNPKY